MGLRETRAYGPDALASLMERARTYSQAADEAAQEYNERSEAIARDLKRDFPKANEYELATLVKQAKEKDLLLETMGRRQEFNAREAVRLYTMFQSEALYRQSKIDWERELWQAFGSPTGRTPKQRS